MMDEEEKKNELSPEQERMVAGRILPWRFWVSVLLSAFLIVMFGFYLPMRFQYQGMLESAMPHTHDAQSHEENEVTSGIAVNFNVSPVPVMTGSSTRLDFFVNNKPGNSPVPSAALEYEHTKLMHVIGVRDDMNEFFHIHPYPTSTPGLLSVNHVFSKPGRYKIWSEIKKDGENHVFGHPILSVAGEGEASNKQVVISRSASVDGYQVAVDYQEPLARKQESEISFDIHDMFGDAVEVESYLAADMHLTIIKDDLTQFIHTHPEGHDMDNHHGLIIPVINEARAHGIEEEEMPAEEHAPGKQIVFHVVFPEAGVYRIYGQFRPKGIDLPADESLTAMFWVRVGETAPLRVSQFSLIVISLISMAVLSWIVKKMLVVKVS